MPGIEGFYTGLRHPLTTPDQILALLGVGFFLGSFAMSRLAPAFAALAFGMLCGLVFGEVAGNPSPWLFALATVTAVAAALAPGRGWWAAVLAASVGGLLLGAASIPDPGPAQDRLTTMAGSFICVLMLPLYLVGALEFLRERVDHPAVRISLRVAAAWIAAIAVLMLALTFVSSTG